MAICIVVLPPREEGTSNSAGISTVTAFYHRFDPKTGKRYTFKWYFHDPDDALTEVEYQGNQYWLYQYTNNDGEPIAFDQTTLLPSKIKKGKL